MSKNNNFVKGAIVLSIAGVIVKILGALYRIPIGNIIKSEGMGYYSTAHPFYTLMLTIATAGFPVAIAKLVSEKRAIGDFKGAFRVFKIALTLLTFGGIFSFLFLTFKAKDIVKSLENENAYYSLISLAPALFFVPIMSAFRGFFQGQSNMFPTAISQIVEQLLRVSGGLFLTIYLLDKGIPIAAGGASFAGSIGAFFGCVIIIFIFLRKIGTIKEEIKLNPSEKEYPLNDILYDLMIIAIPITIGSAIVPIMDTIDAGIVLKRLQAINYSKEMANDMYGQLKGYAQTLINLPQVFSMAIGISLVPAIASSYARNNKREVQRTIGSGIRITLLLGLPCAFGLFVLAKPIIELLFFNNTDEVIRNTGEILKVLSFGVIFLTITQTLTSILQGLGKPLIPVINLIIGAGLKVILTFVLTSIPSVNIKGAAISTVAAFATAAILDLIILIKRFKIKLRYKDVFLKPFICALSMAVITSLSYSFLFRILNSRLTTVISILIGAFTYILLLIITKTITEDDLSFIPKSEKVLKKVKSKTKE
ncbi:putative polysaccharide biosynthesis protein [Tissierella creatinophila]|uniref:Stage V sporulation protein B n=1 Tax=Tissierella creatinophila DSM 6911 TaxID=1123403 RepID=A0A1U7M6U9_TISCR|nr:polysaccharide biosynthesis protein [Tissierella creatinophila]OLS03011.1 stage V sporulation protein B [Tissierella creatinophila DSM 6911]